MELSELSRAPAIKHKFRRKFKRGFANQGQERFRKDNAVQFSGYPGGRQ